MTTKFPSPLLGYNNNVRHKGKVFHIQTEDSGVKYGHIITHLFMDGGRILKSVKTGYAEYIGNERMADIVREMMKQQHKAMFIALRDGKFDSIADGAAEASQSTQALSAQSVPTPAEAVAARPPQPPPPPRSATPPPAMAAPRPASAAPPIPRHDEDPEGPATVRQANSAELTLDIDALERAAVANAASPVLRSQSELPPPPANLFRDKAAGRYRVTPVPPAVAAAPPPPGPARPQTPPPPPAKPAAPLRRPSTGGVPAAERRYAPTRPAAIFGQSRPQPSKSAFGEDLISDKSLDEVILSYLAEDLDDKK